MRDNKWTTTVMAAVGLFALIVEVGRALSGCSPGPQNDGSVFSPSSWTEEAKPDHEVSTCFRHRGSEMECWAGGSDD